jgi:hypothetical protein
MLELFHADGDTWRVSSDAHDSQREVHTVVFHCVSNGQRPYRVVEIPDPLLAGRTLESLHEPELSRLFARSQTMDFSHDSAGRRDGRAYVDPDR